MIEDCVWYKISREQRKSEINSGRGLRGTNGFSDSGCYECRACNISCSSYQPTATKMDKANLGEKE